MWRNSFRFGILVDWIEVLSSDIWCSSRLFFQKEILISKLSIFFRKSIISLPISLLYGVLPSKLWKMTLTLLIMCFGMMLCLRHCNKKNFCALSFASFVLFVTKFLSNDFIFWPCCVPILSKNGFCFTPLILCAKIELIRH